MKVQLLLTGNELMTGDIVDSNSAMIARALSDIGIFVERRVTLPDDFEDLTAELLNMSQRADVIIMNGGLGPTEDDLTADVLAKAMGVPTEEHPEALAHITAWCTAKNYTLSGPNLKQTILPKGSKVIPNPIGSAVGFTGELNGCLVMCTPGVPSELERMLADTIVPTLASSVAASTHNTIRRLRVFGYGESNLQRLLNEHFPDWPANVELGFRASLPMLELKLRIERDEDLASLKSIEAEVRSLLGSHVVTDDDRPLAKVVQDLLLAKGLKVTTAESCTGGLIASQLTSQAGSSGVFEAGFVTYANHIKQAMLDVTADSLASSGAVSQSIVEQMLTGALKKSGADLGVAVSGIAGPGGGTEDKPVGTVWLAWGAKGQIKSAELFIPGSRTFFQQVVAAIALDLVRRELMSTQEQPIYLKERKRPR